MPVRASGRTASHVRRRQVRRRFDGARGPGPTARGAAAVGRAPPLPLRPPASSDGPDAPNAFHGGAGPDAPLSRSAHLPSRRAEPARGRACGADPRRGGGGGVTRTGVAERRMGLATRRTGPAAGCSAEPTMPRDTTCRDSTPAPTAPPAPHTSGRSSSTAATPTTFPAHLGGGSACGPCSSGPCSSAAAAQQQQLCRRRSSSSAAAAAAALPPQQQQRPPQQQHFRRPSSAAAAPRARLARARAARGPARHLVRTGRRSRRAWQTEPALRQPQPWAESRAVGHGPANRKRGGWGGSN